MKIIKIELYYTKKYNLHVIPANSNPCGLQQNFQVVQQSVRRQHLSIAFRRLDKHLINAARTGSERLVNIVHFSVESAALGHPQLLEPLFGHDRLEADGHRT